jgi:tetratricopeptide (TPR) repeat protein
MRLMSSHRTVCVGTALVGLSAAALVWGPRMLLHAAAQDARPAPTFSRDIAPILLAHCAPCHRTGEAAPFSLLTYDDARPRVRQIAEATRRRLMPPWKPEPGFGEFAGTRSLSDDQVAVIQRWADGGAMEGDRADLPPMPGFATGWQLGEPDLVVTMPEAFVLRGSGEDVFRTVVLPIPSSVARRVRGLEFRPGNSKVVHHANIKVDPTRSTRRLDDDEPGSGFDGGGARSAKFPDGHFLGWTPGQSPRLLPEGTSWRLDPSSDLVVELHLMPASQPELVQISVGLFFTNQTPSRMPYMIRLGRQSLDIPAGAAAYTSSDSYVLPVDVDVLAVQPHAHNLAREIRGFARLPDGRTRWLIYIKDWDFHWQDVYQFSEPVALPAGTTLEMQYTYDNSAANRRNPNTPPRRVTFGQTTASEMGDLWLQVVPRNAAELAALDRDYRPKMLTEDTAGDEKMIEVNPLDAHRRADLASCYLEAGRVADALAQLREAVRLEPGTASLRYALGTLLLNQRAFEEAATHFSEAVRLRPGFSEAHNNLGVVSHAQGNIEEAIRRYTEALRTMPDNSEARYNLARAFTVQGRTQEAIAEYRRALAIKPEADTYSNLASLLASTGQVEEAVLLYRRALELGPDLPTALVDLAWLLATSEREDIRSPLEAVRLAERVAGLTSYGDATVLDTLATAYFAAGRQDQSVVMARRALDLATSAGNDELAGRIRKRLGFFQQSQQPPQK